MSTATDVAQLKLQAFNFQAAIAVLQGEIVTLQQRCTRLESQVTDLKNQLAKVRKG